MPGERRFAFNQNYATPAVKGGRGTEMTDKVETNQVEEQTSEQVANDTANTGGAERMFSQSEVNSIIAERAGRMTAKQLSELGVSSIEELSAIVQKSREREQAEMTELQKAQADKAELEKRLEQAAAAQKALTLQTDIVSLSAKLGIVDADAAFRLLDKDAIQFDANGKPTNTEALLNDLLKAKPYLVGAGTSAMNPGRARKFSRDEIEKMSPAEINKNWDAIKDSLESGR